MKKTLIFLLFILFFYASMGMSLSNNHEIDIIFPLTDANAKLESLDAKIDTQKLSLEELEFAVEQLKTLQSQANICVQKARTQLKTINDVLKTNPGTDLLSEKETTDYQYLENKRKLYLKKSADCRLFLFRSQEILAEYNDAIDKISRYRILQKSTPIWEIFTGEADFSFDQLSFVQAYHVIGIKPINRSELTVLSLLILLGVAIGWKVRQALQASLLKFGEMDTPKAGMLATIRTFMIPLVLLSLLSLYSLAYSLGLTTSSFFSPLSYLLLLYVVSIGIFKAIFSPIDGFTNLLHLPDPLGKSFFRRFTIVATIIFLQYLLMIGFENQPVSTELVELFRTLFITILSFFVVLLSWTFCNPPILKSENKVVRWFIRSILILMFLVMVTTEWFGFHRLAIFLLKGILLTALLLAFVFIVHQLMTNFMEILKNREHTVSKGIRFYLGVKPHNDLIELSILKFSIDIIIFVLFIFVLMNIWDVSTDIIEPLKTFLLDGFLIVGMKISPLHLILSLLVFSILLMVARFISTLVARHHQFQGEVETQVAMASIINYTGFAVALIVALFVAGVDFTGLAIIAGALSVGIGLGLQNIVNNFVSGIILLLEKPIKPGDRIKIGDTEGFVKRIRARSTQITTLAREDVIVPNAELITTKIINYMFRDRYARIVCRVGVAYHSDIELVRKLLLEIAMQHPDVQKTGANEPSVLFSAFGESALQFELWCIINDVNKKYRVASDLNFVIHAEFKKHQITIAFPQLDVHVHEIKS